METPDVMNEILTDTLGITRQDLDRSNPVDCLLYSVSREYANHRAQAQHHALRAATEYQRIADTPATEQVHHASTDAQKYHEAVTAMRALNAPLGAAFTAYKNAHCSAEQPDKVGH